MSSNEKRIITSLMLGPFILGFVYPRVVTKGMTIEIMKGRFDPFLSNQIRTGFIKKNMEVLFSHEYYCYIIDDIDKY